MTARTREQDLLLCCSRTRADAPTRERISALLGGELDWDGFLQLANVQQVTPLVASMQDCASLATSTSGSIAGTNYHRSVPKIPVRSGWMPCADDYLERSFRHADGDVTLDVHWWLTPQRIFGRPFAT